MLPSPTAVATQPRTKLTNADYIRLTPPVPDGPRYQLIDGELIAMAGASDRPPGFSDAASSFAVLPQADALGIGEIIACAPYDVHVDEHQHLPARPHAVRIATPGASIVQYSLGAFGAPDVVVEILSDSTRRRDLADKLPVYLRAGVLAVVIVDLAAQTVAVYGDGDAVAPLRVLAASDTLTLDAMPGVAVPLAPLFARALGGGVGVMASAVRPGIGITAGACRQIAKLLVN